MKGLWTCPLGECYRYGRRYRLIDCPALPKPFTPHPPVLVTGPVLKHPSLAAEHANRATYRCARSRSRVSSLSG